MSIAKTLVVALLLPTFANAAGHDRPAGLIRQFRDRNELSNHFASKGYKAKGGIDKDTADRNEDRARSFPTFSSSFTVNGAKYPYTMVGFPPASGRAANLRSVIVPLRMNFVYFGPNFDVNHTFEPGPAVVNLVNSPLYQEADWPNGRGQFGDQMQRATFWNRMDREHQWHLRMARPRIARTVDIEVTPETGELQQLGNVFFGNVLFDFMDSQILTILQFLEFEPDEVPIFVTDGVTNEALGYHSAFTTSGQEGQQVLQTFMFTSWLDPAVVDPIFADVSTFDHELLEWVNDPYINNIVPVWRYPPERDPRASCSFNPFLEVGDPQGNGPTFRDFPAIAVTLKGVTYHLQQLALLQWFTDERPSSAFGGWYSFPDPTSLTEPAVYCK